MAIIEIPNYVLKPILDTIYLWKDVPNVVIMPAPISWDKIATIFVGLFAVLIAVVGWLVNSNFSRKNQRLGFEESVRDRIRVEINSSLIEFKEWLAEVEGVVFTLKWSLEAIVRAKLMKATPYELAILPEYNLEELEDVLRKSNNAKWFERFSEYDILFPQMVNLVRQIKGLTRKFRAQCADFKENHKNTDAKAFEQLKLISLAARDLNSIMAEFFQVFQYECLKTLSQINKPVSEKKHRYYIELQADGKYSIKECERKHVR